MSYLDAPRIHFRGTFRTDPSTNNNDVAAHAPGAPAPGGSWKPDGKHYFTIDALVTQAVDSSGAVKSTTAADPIVGGAITTVSPGGRLVDLDPECQTFSEIWGASISIARSGGAAVSGPLERPGLRDLFMSRNSALGGPGKFGGVFQSVVRIAPGATLAGSTVFGQMMTAAGPRGLSLKLVVFDYDTASFGGKCVGTLGPHLAGDEMCFLATRRMEAGSTVLGSVFTTAVPTIAAPPYNHAPFKVDAARRVLILDLSNSLPVADRAGAAGALGRMHVAVRETNGALTYLGSRIAYHQAQYDTDGGIVEIALTSAEVTKAQTMAVMLKVEQPAVRVIMSERPQGSYLDATRLVARINPGDSLTYFIEARELGVAKSGQVVSFSLLSGTPASGLTFPASVTTGATGSASLVMTAANPGNPRGDVDGQYYAIGFHWGAVAPSNLRGVVNVRVYDSFTASSPPTWAQVSPIFSQYAQLYPAMKAIFDMSVRATVDNPAIARLLRDSMLRSELAVNYMPVTRDLSRDKKAALVAYLNDAIVRGGGTP